MKTTTLPRLVGGQTDDGRAAVHTKEAAQYAGVSYNTMRQIIADGLIYSIQPGGKHARVLVPVWAIEAFLGVPRATDESVVTL
jgi:excisionase family DNA binding protein